MPPCNFINVYMALSSLVGSKQMLWWKRNYCLKFNNKVKMLYEKYAILN